MLSAIKCHKLMYLILYFDAHQIWIVLYLLLGIHMTSSNINIQQMKTAPGYHPRTRLSLHTNEPGDRPCPGVVWSWIVGQGHLWCHLHMQVPQHRTSKG